MEHALVSCPSNDQINRLLAQEARILMRSTDFPWPTVLQPTTPENRGMAAGLISGGIPSAVSDHLHRLHGKQGSKIATKLSERILETRTKAWKDRNDHWEPPFPDFLRAQEFDSEEYALLQIDLAESALEQRPNLIDEGFINAFGVF